MKKSFSPSRAAASLSTQPRKPAQQSPRARRTALACFRASPWPSSRLASPGPRRAPARPHSRACALTPAEADRRVAPPVAELLTARPRATGFLTLLAES